MTTLDTVFVRAIAKVFAKYPAAFAGLVDLALEEMEDDTTRQEFISYLTFDNLRVVYDPDRPSPRR